MLQLNQLALTEVKIDRESVKANLQDDRAIAIVVAILLLAHKLGLNTVAEGIENVTKLNYIRALGCSVG